MKYVNYMVIKMEKLSDKELQALVSLLDDPDREVHAHVWEKLIAQGPEVIPFLEKKWEESFSPEIQKEIEELVHQLQFALLKQRLMDWKASQDQDLLKGLWIINTYQYPDLEFHKLNAEMQQIYFEVWTAFQKELSPFEQVRTINSVLFNRLKFSANTKNFHSPGNSMLSNVLDTKKGNPISLCSIYILVAKRLGLPIFGVSLPNLFVMIYQSKENSFYINAFNKGQTFTRKDIYTYLEQLKIEPLDRFFDPCSNLEIIQRFLRNLIYSFEKLGELDKVEELKTLLQLTED